MPILCAVDIYCTYIYIYIQLCTYVCINISYRQFFQQTRSDMIPTNSCSSGLLQIVTMTVLPFGRCGTVSICLDFQPRFEHNDLINNRMVVLTKAQNDWHHPMCGCKLFACTPQAAHYSLVSHEGLLFTQQNKQYNRKTWKHLKVFLIQACLSTSQPNLADSPSRLCRPFVRAPCNPRCPRPSRGDAAPPRVP